jgi:hypothetical protein
LNEPNANGKEPKSEAEKGQELLHANSTLLNNDPAVVALKRRCTLEREFDYRRGNFKSAAVWRQASASVIESHDPLRKSSLEELPNFIAAATLHADSRAVIRSATNQATPQRRGKFLVASAINSSAVNYAKRRNPRVTTA